MSSAEITKVSEQLSKLSEVSLAHTEGNRQTIPADKMLEYVKRGGEKPDLGRKYVFGPSAEIEALFANEVRYAFRQRDEKQFVLLSGMEGGSCPYLYTRADRNSKWARVRHILYGFNSALKEREEVTALRRFDGSIMVTEEDPEVSHIDLIEVIERLVSGEEHVLHFADGLTSSRDQRRLTLRQGEKHVFQLEHFQRAPGARYFVRAVGYYDPY